MCVCVAPYSLPVSLSQIKKDGGVTWSWVGVYEQERGGFHGDGEGKGHECQTLKLKKSLKNSD